MDESKMGYICRYLQMVEKIYILVILLLHIS